MDDSRRTESDREVTVNQVVAWNLARVRKDAGLTQQQLAEEIGWTADSVSEAERSWNGKRTREFSAQDLAVIALALGVPLAALLLPPADGYWFPDGQGKPREAAELMRLAIPDSADDTPAMRAYRQRRDEHLRRYFGSNEAFTGLAARWVGADRYRAELAGKLRRDRVQLEVLARIVGDKLSAIADQIDPEDEP